MMLFHGPEKRWDYQCTKPRKRKNVFALLFLLLYSRRLKLSSCKSSSAVVATKSTAMEWRSRGGGRGASSRFNRLALPMCVIFSVAALQLLLLVAVPATAQNVSTNNTVNYVKDHTWNAFSTTSDRSPPPPPMTTSQEPPATIKGGDVVDRSVLLLLQNVNNTAAAAAAAGGGAGEGDGLGSVVSASTKSPVTDANRALHKLRYATHSAGVYSSQLQHLDDEDDYIDDDDADEGGAFPEHKKKNITGK